MVLKTLNGAPASFRANSSLKRAAFTFQSSTVSCDWSAESYSVIEPDKQILSAAAMKICVESECFEANAMIVYAHLNLGMGIYVPGSINKKWSPLASVAPQSKRAS